MSSHEGGHGDVYADDGAVDVNVDWMWSCGHRCVCGLDIDVENGHGREHGSGHGRGCRHESESGCGSGWSGVGILVKIEMGICNHWYTDPTQLHFSSLQNSRILTLMLPNIMQLYADLDPQP